MQAFVEKKSIKNNSMLTQGANLKDLARISGYSISTVSKALNNSEEISASTKEKLRKLAIDHNYTPNKMACALRKQKTDIIMVCLPKNGLQQCFGLVEGIIDKAQEKGYQTIVHQYSKKSLGHTLTDMDLERNFDGIIFLLGKDDYLSEELTDKFITGCIPMIKHTGACSSDVQNHRKKGKKMCGKLVENISWKWDDTHQFSKI
nr:LacI family DNA-binding transcriptional regulator [Allomuricauda sp.]